MELIHAPLRAVFDAILAPFAGRSPMLTLVPISAVVGVLALLLFKWTSNQKALEAARRRQLAGFFEIRLFNDDLRNLLGAQGRILRATGRYFLHTLVPLVALLPPLFLLVAQLQFHYGYEGLRPGDTTLLQVRLDEATASADGKPAVTLNAPSGAEVETPAVWIPTERKLVWRLRAVEPGEHTLELAVGGASYTKSLTVSNQVVRRSPVRPGASLGAQLLYPAEAPLAKGGPVTSIELRYPDAEVNLLGWHTHWLIAFFILTVVAALLLKKPLGVTI
ncbi:MAG: hypothetical protein ACRD2Z_12300 [Thermoanaerobaculia bacterium]